ncbi:MAG: Mu transposase C-terminal domain-containing protein [Thalassospira sp.]|uniref:Mu transposase C-terminal domain-containing protein n=1 Tax=Thalassospira sp. TaxID=1912094 RepID=UPI003A871739
MTKFQLPEGSRIKLDGAQYKVVARTAGGEIHLSHLDTGEPMMVPAQDIVRAIYDGEAELTGTSIDDVRHKLVSFDAFSKRDRDEARRKLAFVQKVDSVVKAANLNQAVNYVIMHSRKANSPSVPSKRTLVRWYTAWHSSGRDIRSLLPRHCLKGPKEVRADNRIKTIIWETALEHYLKPEHASGTEVYNLVKRKIERENKSLSLGMRLTAPSRRTVYRWLGNLDPYEVLAAQKGTNVADQKFRPVDSGIGASRPLERVEIDHHLIDLLVVYSNGDVLGRVWLTVALDVYSRMVVGFDISPEAPSYRSIMRCLRNAIAPKDAFVRRVIDEFHAQDGREQGVTIENEWLCFGLIALLVVDNGLEFHSENLLNSAAQIGTSIEYNPKRSPRYKGKVERLFGTLNSKLIHTLEGTTFSNPQERGEYPAEKNAKITIQDLMLLVTKFLVDEYPNSYHEGIRDCPIRKWERGTNTHPVRLLSNPEDLEILTSCVETCTLSRTGVTLLNLQFQSDAIQLLYRRLMSGRMRLPKNPKVKVKFDPENLLTVYVEDPENRVFLPAKCRFETYADGLSVWRHKMIRSVVAKETNGARKHSEEALLSARVTTFELAQQLKSSKQKTTRKRAHRFASEEVTADVVTNLESASDAKEHNDAPLEEFDFSTDEIVAEIERAQWKSTSPSRRTGGENA